MQRYFEIKNFRNLGINEPQKLILNSSLNKDEIGNVIYIVGPNNSGKSNVLKALENFGANKITKIDVPDFDDMDPKPELKLVVYDNDMTYIQEKNIDYQSEKSGLSCKDFRGKEVKQPEITLDAIQFATRIYEWLWQQRYRDNNISTIIKNINSGNYVHDRVNFIQIDKMVRQNWGSDFYLRYIEMDEEKVSKLLKELIDNFEDEIESKFNKKYGYSFIPTIITFKTNELKQSQFIINPSEIKTSSFFNNLFSLIEYNHEEIINSYEKYNERKIRGKLEGTEKRINDKLETITNRFNKLYLLDNKKYRFKVILDPTQISFQIYLDEIALDYDRQSTGFKWFFDFYFTLYSHKKLKAGDIILMDEPATNLHVKGIEELRDFIKEYAKKNKLVFVISTHSPFFIDVDYLENVRVVNRVGNEAIINNKFSLLEDNDIDSLGQIKSALTVSRHILLDPTKKTIFVEGITDYCYLTAFKHFYKMSDLIFLPIDGLNDSVESKKLKKDKDLFDSMLKIEKFPTLLVDADKAGLDAKDRVEKKYKGRIEVITLSDCGFSTIESLFHEGDLVNKKFDDAVTFKNNLNMNKISIKTKENFKKLLDYIRG